jgi:ubiquinol-cytochrome c reductase cytochrome c subunit
MEPRRELGPRRLGALALLSVVAALAVLPFATGAGASPPPTSPPPTTSTTIPTGPTTPLPAETGTAPFRVYWVGIPPQLETYNRLNSGTPNSTIRIFNKAGQLAIYGNTSVLYLLPQLLPHGPCRPDVSPRAKPCSTPALFTLGESLYAQSCSGCHGVTADGVPPTLTPKGGGFPVLRHVGPATIDFWIESGRMPAVATNITQPVRRPARLDHLQALAIATYLNTLWPATPYIPQVNLEGASLSDGAQLFAANCAACHTISGDGDALANSTFAPSLRDIPATQVAEALRTGPANMPIFTGNLTDAQLRDVVAYVVERIEHPQNPGGAGLGGLGPVGEGFVGLALGVGLLALIGFWIGDRS